MVYHNSRVRGEKQLGDTLAPQKKRKFTDQRFKREKDRKIGESVAFSPPQPPISLALSSNSCPITLRRIQEQGSTVLADNISSDVNGILLVFGATPEAGPSEAAVTESRTGLQSNSGVESTREERQTKLQF